MSKLTRKSSEFHEEIHRIERFHAVDEEIVNIQPQELLDNDHYLRDAIGDLEQDLIDHETDVSNPHNVTHAQTGPEAADPTKTTTSRHKHVSDADLKQVYDTKSDLAAHENDNENPHLVTHAQTGPEGATLGTDTTKDKHVSDADYKRWEDHLHTPGAHGSTRVENSEDNGCILIDGVKTTVYTHPDTHPASMITGLHPSATTGVAGSVAWGNVTGKPSTFPPSSHTHSKSDVGLGNVQNYGIATQAQAEAGTANDVYMTPLRVAQAIQALGEEIKVAYGSFEIESGLSGHGVVIGFEPHIVFLMGEYQQNTRQIFVLRGTLWRNRNNSIDTSRAWCEDDGFRVFRDLEYLDGWFRGRWYWLAIGE